MHDMALFKQMCLLVDFQVSKIGIMLPKSLFLQFQFSCCYRKINTGLLKQLVVFLPLFQLFSEEHLLDIVLLLFPDDFEETTGIKRIIQALHAHTWSNLEMKGIKYSLYSNKVFVIFY